MRIAILSGKGGTGKTTLTASLIPYFEELVIADCDVDAPDLNILFELEPIAQEEFIGLKKAFLDEELCIKCGKCYDVCKFTAIEPDIKINIIKCEGCGVCEYICPVLAIQMKDRSIGDLFVSKTKYGDMVHARLIPGEEASGKLVSKVRKIAKELAVSKNLKNIIVDGSPGIACSVISSITGAKKIVIVTEPTFSGIHDLKRVYELTQKFNLKVYVVINKWDISLEHTKLIESYCNEKK